MGQGGREMNYPAQQEKARERLNQRLYAASKNPNLVPAPTYCNYSTTGLYTGNRMSSPREGANQHMNYTSAPLAAQIVRV